MATNSHSDGEKQMMTVRQLTDIRKETPRNRDRDTEGDREMHTQKGTNIQGERHGEYF